MVLAIFEAAVSIQGSGLIFLYVDMGYYVVAVVMAATRVLI